MTRKKKPTASLVRSSAAEYLTFVAASGTGGVEAIYADENVWLSQKMMAQLYDVDVRTINYHLKTIFTDSELEEGAVIQNFWITVADGKTYDTKHYTGPSTGRPPPRSSSTVPTQPRSTWGSTPGRRAHGKIQKFDVVVAKNYLTEDELAQLSRLVNAYLDVAENMALRKIPMTMQDWETRLNRFLDATDHAVLSDAGKVTAEIAKAHAEAEFEKYRIVQDRLFESDFDRVVAETKRLSEGAPKPTPAKPKRGKKP